MKEKTQNKQSADIDSQDQKKWITILKKIGNIVINILIVIVLLTSILIATLALTSKANGISSIFGNTIQTIQSDSMKGGSPDGYEGGDFAAGDLVIGKATNFDDYAVYEIGDIVTFKTKDTEGNDVFVVHRIVDKATGTDGFPRYQTWGDNREVSQVPDQLSEDDYIAAYEIASVVYSKDVKTTVLRGVGSALDFIRTSQGFFFVVLLPMIIFFVYEIIRVVLNAVNYRNAKAKEAMQQSDEERQAEIDAAVKAALEAAGKGGASAVKDSAPADDDSDVVLSEAKDLEDSSQARNDKADVPEITSEQMEQFKQFLAFQKAQKAKNEEKSEEPSVEE